MATQPSNAIVHGRSVALVRYSLRGDSAAMLVELSDVAGPEAAAAQILSLASLCGLLLSEVPEPERDRQLDRAALTLATVEDKPAGE